MNYINEYKKWINSDYFDRKTREELLNIEHDKKEIEERGKHYNKKANNFKEYSDMNMRYLRISGKIGRASCRERV